jgi:heme-degrading monooxygenase HmoA
MFERYDEASRRALFFARYEVAQLGGLTIEPEHLVLGILRGSAQDILRFASPGTTADTIRNALQLPASQPKVSTSVEIPFSQGTKDALLRAPIEADDLSNVFIRPEHIVLGILVKTSGEAARALNGAGVTVDAVRAFLKGARDAAPATVTQLISRHWKGVVKPGQEEAYLRHLDRETFPALHRVPGFVHASILRRPIEHGTEFQIITVWHSIEAIKAFAGADVEAAVVPPAAAALLSSYDRRAVHYEIVNSRGDHR